MRPFEQPRFAHEESVEPKEEQESAEQAFFKGLHHVFEEVSGYETSVQSQLAELLGPEEDGMSPRARKVLRESILRLRKVEDYFSALEKNVAHSRAKDEFQAGSLERIRESEERNPWSIQNRLKNGGLA